MNFSNIVQRLSSDNTLPSSYVLSNPDWNWDYSEISKSPLVTSQLVEKMSSKFEDDDWFNLSATIKLTDSIIEENHDKLVSSQLSKNPNFTLDNLLKLNVDYDMWFDQYIMETSSPVVAEILQLDHDGILPLGTHLKLSDNDLILFRWGMENSNGGYKVGSLTFNRHELKMNPYVSDYLIEYYRIKANQIPVE